VHIAVVTFDGFNEIDTFVASAILNRMKPHGWRAYIASPTSTVTSMNGATVERQRPLEFAAEADAVLIGSGTRTLEFAADPSILSRLTLDPSRQLVAAQCSGALLLAKLGLLPDRRASTDRATTPWLVEAGVEVTGAAFEASGNVATAGGCLASQHLATWTIARGESLAKARAILSSVAPVGEEDLYVDSILARVTPFLESGQEGRADRRVRNLSNHRPPRTGERERS
jgi:transcriptional regulator GlxA family with amidase domain